jgi:site-specific recombinase XerD
VRNTRASRAPSGGYKPATIKRRIAAIRGFFEWLLALDALEKNPANRHVLRRVRSSAARDRALLVLTAEQAARLVEAASEAGDAAPRDRALILTLLHCVLRRSEAAGMDVEHVRPLGHYWVLDLPATKGGSDQYVKMPAHVVEEIDAMKACYGITDGPLWRSLSNNSRGNRLSERSVYGIVDAAARRAGLPEEVGAHTLRHSGCTLAIEAGASIQQVQAHARHKNIETTMVYVHQRDRLRDSAADYIRIDTPPSRRDS